MTLAKGNQGGMRDVMIWCGEGREGAGGERGDLVNLGERGDVMNLREGMWLLCDVGALEKMLQ